jgi:uncharacterized membrane protein
VSNEEPVRVYSTMDALRAQMFQLRLRDEGIQSYVENLHQGALTGVLETHVSVAPADAERATEIVAEMDKHSGEFTLAVATFDKEETADEVQLALRKMESALLIDLEDSVVIIHDANGRVAIKQTHNLTQYGAFAGGLCGAIVGAMFMSPVIGLAAGAAVGATVGATDDIGIEDSFLKEIGDSMSAGTSALAVLIRRSDPEPVLKELAKHNGRITKTALLHNDEKRLFAILTNKGE